MGELLLPRVRKALAAAGDPVKARAMQAYLKSAMPFHGVPAPLLRRICTATFAEVQIPSAASWRARVLEMWRGARFREERYAALLLAGDARARAFQSVSAMPVYEELIVTGAWWDYVDDIAAHRIGPILRQHPAAMKRRLLSWSRSTDMWKRRAAILAQLGLKGETDLTLLYACIEPSLDSPEFFLRKAIGWALRQYARTDGAEVRRYVRLNRARLSALSRREALKHLGQS